MNFNDPSHYLPHRSPMLLIDKVISHSADSCICSSAVSEKGRLAPFLTQKGELLSIIGPELIFQTIGVYSGICDDLARRPAASTGMALGIRNYSSNLDVFPAQSELIISIQSLMNDETIGSFTGDISCDGKILCSGRFTVCRPNEEELLNLCKR